MSSIQAWQLWGRYIVDTYSPITGAEDLQLPRGSANGNKEHGMEEKARMSDTRARLARCEIYRLLNQGGGRVCLTLSHLFSTYTMSR